MRCGPRPADAINNVRAHRTDSGRVGCTLLQLPKGWNLFEEKKNCRTDSRRDRVVCVAQKFVVAAASARFRFLFVAQLVVENSKIILENT